MTKDRSTPSGRSFVAIVVVAGMVVAVNAWHRWRHRQHRPEVIVLVGPPWYPNFSIFTGGEVASVGLTTDQQVSLAVTETDAAGNPVQQPDPDQWSSSDATVASVAPDPSDASGLSGLVVAQAPGTATVTVTVPVQQSDGSTTDVTGSIDVTVSAPADPVTGVTITPGQPQPKPAPPGP